MALKPASLPLLPLKAHPLRPSCAVWAVGKFLFAYDAAKGAWEQCRKELHEDAVRSLDAFAEEGAVRWLSGGDDKKVAIWKDEAGDWQPLQEMSHGKKVTVTLFDKAGKALFADRFGDVYRWNGDHSEAELLFTHLAIVTAMAFTPNGRILVSGDNHEKIRVSCYPLAAEIQSFCLGHIGQITALACPSDDTVFSASTDCTLRLWRLRDDKEPEAVAVREVGSAVNSLVCLGQGAVLLGCEAAPGLRSVSAEGEMEAIAEPSPQAVAALADGKLLWVDRSGHLRLRGGEAAWEDVFQGEDLPAAVVCLSKNADPNWQDEGPPEEGESAFKAKKRRPGK